MNKTIERAKREHCALSQGFPDSEYIKELNNIETTLKESIEIKDKYAKLQAERIVEKVLNEKKLKTFDTLSKNNEKVMKELSKEIEKNRALEIIKELFIFSLEFDESQNEWFLYVSNQEQYILFAKGTGIKTYDLLKEVLL